MYDRETLNPCDDKMYPNHLKSGPKVFKLFMLNSTEQVLINDKIKKIVSCFNYSDVLFILLISVKMPTIVELLAF